ncbi:MAG TPA: M56 family metallopeptidase, partial [Gemmatimonadales bacterium]|nr:M56 family metallopeptidase [Gemmatimonadales bacterium]
MTSLSAPWIVAVVVKATLLLLIVFGLSRLLRRRSAALRHLVWCAAIAGVLAVPLLSVTVPWRLPVKTAMVPDVAGWQSGRAAGGAELQGGRVAEKAEGAAREPSVPPAAPAASAETHTINVAGLLLAIWLAGAALVLLRLVLGWAIVRRLATRALPLEASEWTRPLYEAADRLGLAEVPRLVMSERTPMPFAGGLLRPTIVLPAEATAWTGQRRRAVLAHELAHVRRADIAVNALGQIACALYWFHPLVWLAAKRLRTESERACDNLVLGLGTRPSDYADHLLQIVCGAGDARTPALALPMAERREFEGRMLAILERDASRHAPSRVHAGVLAGLAAVMVLPLAALVPTAAPAPATKDGPAAAAAEQPRIAGPAVHQPADTPRARDARSRDGDVHVATTAKTETRTRTNTMLRTSTETRTAMEAPAGASRADTGDTRVASALIGTLHDPSARVRLSAVTALGNLESRQAT